MANLENTKRDNQEQAIVEIFSANVLKNGTTIMTLDEMFCAMPKTGEEGTEHFKNLIRYMYDNKLVRLASVSEKTHMEMAWGGGVNNAITMDRVSEQQLAVRRELKKAKRKAKELTDKKCEEAKTDNGERVVDPTRCAINNKQLSDIMKKSTGTLGAWRKKGTLKSFKVGRKVWYDLSGGLSALYTGKDKATIEILRLHDKLATNSRPEQKENDGKLKVENERLKKEVAELKKEVANLIEDRDNVAEVLDKQEDTIEKLEEDILNITGLGVKVGSKEAQLQDRIDTLEKALEMARNGSEVVKLRSKVDELEEKLELICEEYDICSTMEDE